MEGVTDMPMVPLSWLADHVDVPEGTDAEALAAALVKVGLEEEEIHPARVIGPLAEKIYQQQATFIRSVDAEAGDASDGHLRKMRIRFLPRIL